ncbi:MAG: two-component system histidine kinase PnpS [Bacillota bacterium]
MFRWNKLSLRNQILIFFIVVLILILGLVFYYFSRNQTELYMKQLNETLKNEARLIIDNEKADLLANSPRELDEWAKSWGAKIDTRITIVKEDGIVLADSSYEPEEMDNHRNRPEINPVLENGKISTSSRKSDTLNKRMFYLAAPVKKSDEIIGVVRLAKPLNEIDAIIGRNVRNYFLFIMLIFIITFLLTAKFTTNITNPLSQITRMAENIAEGNYSERIKLESYGNEIGVMARMFNYMAEQLQNKIKEIFREKKRAETILNSMVDGLIATDIDKKVVMINPAARELLNIKSKTFHKENLFTVIRNYSIDQLLGQSLTEKKTLTREITINNPDKKILRCHFTPISSAEEDLIGGIIVLTDITELRHLEQVRKDFVANVSHELRTPLTSIIGYVDTLIESDIEDSDTRGKFLEVIKKEADRLALLIRDLLNLSKYEDSDYELKPSDFNAVLEKVMNRFQDKAEAKEISIYNKIEKDLPLVKMIPEQVEQVLTNLIDNSIKYTSKGGNIFLRSYRKSNRIYFEIEDNGIGIPEKDRERIFERFYRVDKARSRELGGTGIGLSIVKHIIQGHNSQIEVSSKEGEGSLFKFYLEVAE